ncbi:MAG: hypothetical protein ACLTL2_20045 [Blautia sp.]|uniref:hypothetical protein n=1 Tax=Blautia sp. TaxID=1955243 RepID=UPI00399693CF
MIDDIFDIIMGLTIFITVLGISKKTRIGKYINSKSDVAHKHNKELYPDCPLFSDDDKE